MSIVDYRDIPWARTYACYKLKKRVFLAWRDYHIKSQLSLVHPLANGLTVFALFKWIALTLRKDEGQTVYTFPFHAIHEYNRKRSRGRQEINSNFFISRIRRYAAEQLHLPEKHFPLFVHAIALLDAFSLLHSFRSWKAIYLRNKRLDDYFKVNYCRRLLRIWASEIRYRREIRGEANAVRFLHQRRELITLFDQWKRTYHASRMIRNFIYPRRRWRLLEKFIRRIHRIRVQRCQWRLGHCHYVTVRLARAFHLLQNSRIAVSDSLAFAESNAIRESLLARTKLLFYQQIGLYWLAEERSRLYRNHPFYHHLLSSLQSLYSPQLTQKAQQWKQMMVILQQGSPTQRARVFLAKQYHRQRATYRAMVKWMTFLIQRALDSPNQVSYFAKKLSGAYSLLPASNQQQSSLFKTRELGRAYILRKRSVYAWKRWRQFLVQQRYFRRCVLTIQTRVYRSRLIEVFGSWLIVTARFRIYNQLAHRICKKAVHKSTALAFYAWRRQYERSALLRANRLELMRQQEAEIAQFSTLVHNKYDRRLKHAVLRSWFLYVKDRARALRLSAIHDRIHAKDSIRLAWTQWCLHTSLATIVNCMKKLWRGYVIRFIKLPKVYKYLQWYRKQAIRFVAFRRYSLKKRAFNMFRAFHKNTFHQFLGHAVEKRLSYNFHKLFQYFRRKRWQRQVLLAGRHHYWNHYPRILFVRWLSSTRSHKIQLRKALVPYRMKLIDAINKLKGARDRYRRAVYARFVGNFKVFHFFRITTGERAARRTNQALDLIQATKHFLRPFFLFLYHYSLRLSKSRKMRLRRLWMRRGDYFRHWFRLISQKRVINRLPRLFHNRMTKLRYLHKLRDYRFDYFNQLVQADRRGELFAPRSTEVEEFERGEANNPYTKNLAKAMVLRGRVSSFLRIPFSLWLTRTRLLASTKRWREGQLRKMNLRYVRAAFKLLFLRWKRAVNKVGYKKRRLLKAATGQVRGALPTFTTGAYYNQPSVITLQRLRGLWYHDHFQNSHLYIYYQGWKRGIQSRKRRALAMRQVLADHNRRKIQRIFWSAFLRLRKRRHSRRIHYNVYKHYVTTQVECFFARLRHRLKLRRRRRKILSEHRKERYVEISRTSIRQWKRRARYYQQLHKRCICIARLKEQCKLFLRRMKRSVYMRKYDRTNRIVAKRFRQRLLMLLYRWQGVALRRKRATDIVALVDRNYILAKKKEGLVQWRLMTIMRKKMVRLCRRFYLVPSFKLWRIAFRQWSKYHRIFQIMRKKINKRVKYTYWVYWKIYITKKVRLQLQYNLVATNHLKQERKRILLAWLATIDNHRLYKQYLTTQSRHLHWEKKRLFKAWYTLTLRFELINFRNLKSVWINWRYNVNNYLRQAKSEQLATTFRYNRLLLIYLKKWFIRHKYTRYYKQRIGFSNRRYYRKTFLRYFRKWKRFMYVLYYHHKAPILNRNAEEVREEQHLAALRAEQQYHSPFRKSKNASLLGGNNRSQQKRREPQDRLFNASNRASYLNTSNASESIRRSHSASPSLARAPRFYSSSSTPSPPPLQRSALDVLDLDWERDRAFKPPRHHPSQPPRQSQFRDAKHVRIYHEHLQHKYRRYSRLLNYDRDDSLWQPYRCFVHWHRVAANRRQYHLDLLAKRIFGIWKHYIHVYKFKKLAFLSRLRGFQRRHLLLIIWRPLRENYRRFVNAKYLAFLHQRRVVSRLYNWWLECYLRHQQVRRRVATVCMVVYRRQLLRYFRTWLVKIRHTGPLNRIWIVTTRWQGWRKLFLANLFRKILLSQRAFLGWKQYLQINNAAYQLQVMRRHKLALLVHKWNSRFQLYLRLAFHTWKYKPLHDITFAQYIQAINRVDPDIPANLRLLDNETIYKQIYSSMEKVDEAQQAEYNRYLLHQQLGHSQAGRVLLFPEQVPGQVLQASVSGMALPRHLRITQALHEKCGSANPLVLAERPAKPPRPLREVLKANVAVKSLRDAMSQVIHFQEQQHRRLDPRSAQSPLASPSKYLGLSKRKGSPAKSDRGMMAESKTGDYIYTPVASRTLGSTEKPTREFERTAAQSLRLQDIL